ncbi:molecular chaperone [Phreatobacter aquaticus]|uniref:Molecular chaperone n=1 Tax=Phreatobacter aquaticus TaxID=2570229 RepID=A0A4D7QLS8_9HYPH|nr:Cro/CI family transcriptional regulator [Phreatobacter aquaticus]QCK86953.1 molecular chaperone [Phreatobacter aquaticus]
MSAQSLRDGGLQEAIKAVGGVGALARALGISQPSVSNWQKVPPERVIAIEQISGVARGVLRPDLYPEMRASLAAAMEAAKAEQAAAAEPDDMDRLRAAEYGLLALLLFKAPTAAVLAEVSNLKGDASPLGLAHLALAEAARDTTLEAANRQFFDLFVGLGRGELLPYASYYLTGFLHERPLAEVRADFIRFGIVREDESKEPEDHIALLFDVMAGLALGSFGDGYADEKTFFETHLKPWAARFFADLETIEGRPLYATIGRVGRLFMDIETEAFAFAG